MNERENIVSIRVDRLYPHPDNPRKHLGDLTEMVESVRKNGIMQNLTVIPISALNAEPDKQPEAESISLLSDFHVLIGHRRLAAAKEAGLTEVPCRIISKISMKEQVSIMLEENMQRNDLTIYEQAQGFQMMLDLGETADTIAEKTGFSKATIYHRLNLAKLDGAKLKEKEKDESFQLSLKDLYELEKIKDVETRNKVLAEARTSGDLVLKAKQAVREEARQVWIEEMKPLLESAGIKEAPKVVLEKEWYSNKWERLEQYFIDKECPKKIKVRHRKNDELFWLIQYNSLYIIRKQEKKQKSKEALEREEQEARKKKLKAMMKNLSKKTKEYIRCIIEGEIAGVKETPVLREQILAAVVGIGLTVYRSNIIRFFVDEETWNMSNERKTEVMSQFEGLSYIKKMLLLLYLSIGEMDFTEYDGSYNQEKAADYKKLYELLELYGWVMEEEDLQIVDGTHELYKKEEEDNE